MGRGDLGLFGLSVLRVLHRWVPLFVPGRRGARWGFVGPSRLDEILAVTAYLLRMGVGRQGGRGSIRAVRAGLVVFMAGWHDQEGALEFGMVWGRALRGSQGVTRITDAPQLNEVE